MGFEEKVLGYCEKEKIIEQGDRIVVGVSGGMDSVCLLELLYKLKERYSLSLYVIHVHHGIRGAEADSDAALVEQMVRERELPFRLVRENVPAIAEKEGLAEEEAGRKVRYKAFEAYREEVGANKIAVAHHEDDRAETVLFHLFRGTGPRGLCGMLPVRGNIIRPLLAVSRQEIEAYVRENGIAYAVDGTNLLPEYTRNRIRLTLLPYVCREINRQAAPHIAGAAEKLSGWRRYIEKQGAAAAERMVQKKGDDIYLSVEDFAREDEVIQDEVLRIVFAYFAAGGKDISEVHYAQARALAGEKSGGQFCFPGNFAAVREYGCIRFGRIKEPVYKRVYAECPVPEEFDTPVRHRIACACGDGCSEGAEGVSYITFEVKKRSDLPTEILQKDYTKWLDYDKIKGDLVLRNPKEGDYLILNEKGDRKKLSRCYIDWKIPAAQRSGQLVLAEGKHVVWAVPERISYACRITEQTKKVLVVTKERDLL